MKEQNQLLVTEVTLDVPGETSEERETRIRAEIMVLTDGKTPEELVKMIINTSISNNLEHESHWLTALEKTYENRSE